MAQSGTVIFVARILRIDGCIGIELGLGLGENDYSVAAVRRGGGWMPAIYMTISRPFLPCELRHNPTSSLTGSQSCGEHTS